MTPGERRQGADGGTLEPRTSMMVQGKTGGKRATRALFFSLAPHPDISGPAWRQARAEPCSMWPGCTRCCRSCCPPSTSKPGCYRRLGWALWPRTAPAPTDDDLRGQA